MAPTSCARYTCVPPTGAGARQEARTPRRPGGAERWPIIASVRRAPPSDPQGLEPARPISGADRRQQQTQAQATASTHSPCTLRADAETRWSRAGPLWKVVRPIDRSRALDVQSRARPPGRRSIACAWPALVHQCKPIGADAAKRRKSPMWPAEHRGKVRGEDEAMVTSSTGNKLARRAFLHSVVATTGLLASASLLSACAGAPVAQRQRPRSPPSPPSRPRHPRRPMRRSQPWPRLRRRRKPARLFAIMLHPAKRRT